MHNPNSLTTERLWAQANALLDTRQDPLADPAFADAYADALGEALQRADRESSAFSSDELERLLATVQALQPAQPKRGLQNPLARRFPWAAALAAALLMLFSQHALQVPHSTITARTPEYQDANAQPQLSDWINPMQPAAQKPRSSIVRLKIERNAVLPRTNAHAALKQFETTSKQSR